MSNDQKANVRSEFQTVTRKGHTMRHEMGIATISLVIAAALLLGLTQPVGAVIVNVDFDGERNNPGPDAPGTTFVGPGAAGGGTFFNGLIANSKSPPALPDDDSAPGDGDKDNLTVSGGTFLSDISLPTTVSFTVVNVGGDNTANGALPGSAPALFGDYVFNNSAGNSAGTSFFTISGLGETTVDVYLYFSFGTVGITGETADPFTPSTIFTVTNTLFFDDVPVAGGSIGGFMGPGTTVFNGFTVEFTPVPEPSTLALLSLGGLAFVRRLRRPKA